MFLKISMKNKYFSYWPLLALAPALVVGPRFIYLFEISIVLYWLALFSKKDFSLHKGANLLICIVIFSYLCILFLQYISIGGINSFSLVRVFLIISPVLVYKQFSEFEVALKKFNFVILFASALAIAQFSDGYLLNSFFGINSIVGFLYPYGDNDLDQDALYLSGGAKIAVNSYNSATSIADGHSILLGDFLAVCGLILIYQKKYLLYFLVLIATLITFSRASWLMLFVGTLFLSFGNKKDIIYLASIFSLVIMAILIVDPLYNAFYFRIANTLFAFGFSDMEIGSSIDGRSAVVWPNFFEALNGAGWIGWLVGFEYKQPVDSGIFSLLRDAGILGLILILYINLWILNKLKKDSIARVMMAVMLLGLFFHPIDQGLRLLFIFYLFLAFKMRDKLNKFETN